MYKVHEYFKAKIDLLPGQNDYIIIILGQT